jgi:hypothetical protein
MDVLNVSYRENISTSNSALREFLARYRECMDLLRALLYLTGRWGLG